jgi:hypothetical protein
LEAEKMLKLRFVLAVTFMLILTASCASHKAAQIPPLAFDLEAQQNQTMCEGVVLMAKPIHSKTDQEQYFDVDLLEDGILPIQVHVCNKGHENPIVLSPESLNLINASGDRMPICSHEQVMDSAKRSYWRTAGWGAAFGLIGIIPSLINVSNTNKQIEADFSSRELKGGTVVNGGTTEGLVFFSVPPEINSLNGWKLSLLVSDSVEDQKILVEQGLHGTVVPRPKPKVKEPDEASDK